MDGALQQGLSSSPSRELISESESGSYPLRNDHHEKYCRRRALLCPKIEAYRHAFDYAEDNPKAPAIHALRGNASRLERRKDVAARIAYLSRDEEGTLREKRKRLEEFLWTVHETNYTAFFTTVDELMFNEDGEILRDENDKPLTRKAVRLRPFEELSPDQQHMIESLKYTEKGRPVLGLYSKMQANTELRKLLGFNLSADEPTAGEFERMSDRQLFAELARQAQELGVNVTLTYDGTTPPNEA